MLYLADIGEDIGSLEEIEVFDGLVWASFLPDDRLMVVEPIGTVFVVSVAAAQEIREFRSSDDVTVTTIVDDYVTVTSAFRRSGEVTADLSVGVANLQSGIGCIEIHDLASVDGYRRSLDGR